MQPGTALAIMHLPSRAECERFDKPPVCWIVSDAFDIDLDARSQFYLSETPLSGENDVCWISQADLTVIQAKYTRVSVKEQTTLQVFSI